METTLINSDLKQVQQSLTVEQDEQVDTKDLTRSAGRGALWQVFGAAWQFVFQMGASVVLARVLDPEDYGIVGAAVLAQGLVRQIQALGTRAGVIAKKDVTQDDLSTSFWITVFIQVTLFLICFISAPLFGRFFKAPEGMAQLEFASNLTWILRATSVTFLMGAASGMSATLLSKNLRFGILKIIDCGGIVIQYASSIYCAVVLDLEYWALVLGVLVGQFSTTIATIICARWLPSLKFSRKSFRYLFRFGIHGLGASLANYFQNNIDYILTGRLLGTYLLGLYEFAYRIPNMINNRLASPIRGVLFPSLAKVGDNNELLAAGYIKTVKFLAFIAFPMLGGLAAIAEPTVRVLWGEKWLAVIAPLQLLCFRSAIQCLIIPISSVFMCKNRPDIPFKYALYTLFSTFGLVAVLGYFYSLIGIAIGMLAACAPALIYLWLAFHIMKVPLHNLFRALLPTVFSSTVSSLSALLAAGVLEAAGFSIYLVFAVSVVFGALGYVLTMWFVFRGFIIEVYKALGVILARKTRSV